MMCIEFSDDGRVTRCMSVLAAVGVMIAEAVGRGQVGRGCWLVRDQAAAYTQATASLIVDEQPCVPVPQRFIRTKSTRHRGTWLVHRQDWGKRAGCSSANDSDAGGEAVAQVEPMGPWALHARRVVSAMQRALEVRFSLRQRVLGAVGAAGTAVGAGNWLHVARRPAFRLPPGNSF